MNKTTAIVLAAGQGARMKSDLPKVVCCEAASGFQWAANRSPNP